MTERIRVVLFGLLIRFHQETTCGNNGQPHCDECQQAVDVLGFTGHEEFEQVVAMLAKAVQPTWE